MPHSTEPFRVSEYTPANKFPVPFLSPQELTFSHVLKHFGSQEISLNVNDVVI